MEYVILENGLKMPIIGFGTYFLDLSKVEESVYNALINGYRHIDTAKWYRDETLIRKALERANIPREELFITGKIEDLGYNQSKIDLQETINDLGVEYLDLILIHWPNDNYLDTYKALEEAYDKGLVKAIGLSNFNERQTKEILNNCRIRPQVNQIETHIYFQEKKMNKFLQENNIIHESWAPFAEGYLGILTDKAIEQIAKKYNKSNAQIILRFFIEQNIPVIPKSYNANHIKENIDIFDFKLEKEDIELIKSLDKKTQYSPFPPCMKEETYY